MYNDIQQQVRVESQFTLFTCRLEKFREDTPTSPEVIVAHTLNFRPNFKFSRLIFFGGDPRLSWGVR